MIRITEAERRALNVFTAYNWEAFKQMCGVYLTDSERIALSEKLEVESGDE